MFDDDEKLLQLDRDRDHRRQHDDKRPLLFAGHELAEGCLDHLGATRPVQKAVEVVHNKHGRAVLVGECRQRTQRYQRLAGAGAGRFFVCRRAREANPVGHIPDANPPILFAGNAEDLALGLIGFPCFDPDASECSVDVLGQSSCQAHSWISCCCWAVSKNSDVLRSAVLAPSACSSHLLAWRQSLPA
jgi:hypothetical protein